MVHVDNIAWLTLYHHYLYRRVTLQSKKTHQCWPSNIFNYNDTLVPWRQIFRCPYFPFIVFNLWVSLSQSLVPPPFLNFFWVKWSTVHLDLRNA
ncbi:uncharacterized protein DS421_3g81110 [Arachis hypogaea]|nr:uncharacterized protein DS421_3g81110 [Arachis hypogaea]